MERTLVNDSHCEQQVLGTLLCYPSLYHDVSDLLSEEMFYNPTHALVYKAIHTLMEQGDNADCFNTHAWLNSHEPNSGADMAVLTEMMDIVITTSQLSDQCLRLKNLWQRRQLWKIGQRLVMAGYSEVAETHDIKQKAIEAVAAIDEQPSSAIVCADEVLDQLRSIVEGNLTGVKQSGIPTGFRWLDDKGGLQRSDLVVIAAEFSQGKTSLAIDFCVNAARAGHPCVFYSTEMMNHQLMARVIARHCGLPSRVIIQEKLQPQQMKSYDDADTIVRGLPVYFDDTATISVERIIASIRVMARKKKVEVAFIDYLQVLQSNERNRSQNEEQFYGIVSRRLKNLAKELNICVVLISQLSRDKKTFQPTLARLRGSGQIAEAADSVLLIYRPGQYDTHYTGIYRDIDPEGTALISLAKGRNVGTGDFICGFNPATTHFFDLSVLPKVTDSFTPRDNDAPF